MRFLAALLTVVPLLAAAQQSSPDMEMCVARHTRGIAEFNLARTGMTGKADGTNLDAVGAIPKWVIANDITNHQHPYSVTNISDFVSDQGRINLSLSCVLTATPERILEWVGDLDTFTDEDFAELFNNFESSVMSSVIRLPSDRNADIDAGIMQITAMAESSLSLAMQAPNTSTEFVTGIVSLVGSGLINLWQHTNYTFLDGKDQPIDYVYSEYNILDSLEDNMAVPKGTRSVRIDISTNSPVYCLGRYDFFFNQFQIKNIETYQKLANITAIIALALGCLGPLLLFAEAKFRGKTMALKMIDLIQAQGSRYVRALLVSLPASYLFMTLRWLQSSKKDPDNNVIPLFGGVSSSFLNKNDRIKVAKTPIFMLCFILIGLVFWPVFAAYAHVNEGSRFAAVIGLLALINASFLRVCLYLLMTPLNLPTWRHIIVNLFEIIAYAVSLAYFAWSVAAPAAFENKIRKTNFRNAVHVKSLLRKHTMPEYHEEIQEPATLFEKIKARITGPDLRPIWLRGRAQDSLITRIKVFYANSKIPARLVAIFAMILLFTYLEIVTIMIRVFDKSPKIACLFGLRGNMISQVFTISSEILETMAPVEFFGVSLSEAIKDVGILSDAVNLFKNIIQGSTIAACILTMAVLIFNLIDLSVLVITDLAKMRVGNYEGFTQNDVRGAISSKASKYMGLQIGFAVIGTMYTMLVFIIVCVLLAFFCTVPSLRKLVWNLALQNGTILVALVISIILSLIQSLIIDKLFVAWLPIEDQKISNASEEDLKGKPLLVSTRFWLKSLNNYNHIDSMYSHEKIPQANKTAYPFFLLSVLFLFPNLVSGIFGFVASIATALVASAVFSYRLDKPASISFFSKSGFYLSWIYQEHHNTNAVLLIAVKMLLDTHVPSQQSSLSQFIQSDKYAHDTTPYTNLSERRLRARNRWHLAFTLIRNPQLAVYRKQRVMKTYLEEYVTRFEGPRLKQKIVENEAIDNANALAQRRLEMRVAETEYWRAHRVLAGQQQQHRN
ncbi:hypothetical protein HDU80_006248 [Chytriomyces hyalinus]|nr:hypothetical protein HDU80_006248 [Chytriomyces hyalinus]